LTVFFFFNIRVDQELKRKKQQEILISRTKEQVKEIEDLLADYKKIEASQKKQLGEKRRLLKATDSASATATPTSGRYLLHSLLQYLSDSFLQ